jgi:hypothetical protein
VVELRRKLGTLAAEALKDADFSSAKTAAGKP